MKNLDDRRAGHRNIIDIAELLATPSQQFFTLLDKMLLYLPVLVSLSIVHVTHIYEDVQIAVLQISESALQHSFRHFFH